MMPVIRPTSQYGPCSEANRTATSQNAEGTYFPSGTFWKSFEINQRISQPRQNNSSRIGTRKVHEMNRIAMNGILPLSSGETELTALPVMEFSKSQKWR